MRTGQKLWTREELILAINLYCKIPFGTIHNRNPQVIHVAKLIGRSPSSVSYKLVNFASLDPSLQARGIKGATNASKLDKEIWDEFFDNLDELTFKSEQLLAKKEHNDLMESNYIKEISSIAEGKEREQLVKLRVNQNFFRNTILAAYNNTCCITGLRNPELLIAGHIRPWGADVKNRLNPRNGLALNALHDKAFEGGFITITPEYRIRISSQLKFNKNVPSMKELFFKYENCEIILPTRFLPDPEFLKYHNDERFRP